MAFGPIMQMTVGDMAIELAPVTKESLGQFISPGMQQASVTRYLSRANAPTLEDEVEWYDTTRADTTKLVWGIWHTDGQERILIGNTALFDITTTHVLQATSSSMVTNKDYWGKGIASTIHKARTWYAFQHMGLIRVKSAVVHGNVASKKALEKSGYTLVYVERNTAFIDGELRHQDNMECINPGGDAWARWWGKDIPPSPSLSARQVTRAVMEWASENVRLL